MHFSNTFLQMLMLWIFMIESYELQNPHESYSFANVEIWQLL